MKLDEVVLLGDNEEVLRANTHTLLSNAKKLGLEVNINKTKYRSQIDIHYIM